MDARFREGGRTETEREIMTTQLHVTALGLPGVLLLKSIVHADARGSFTQSWQAADWRAAGVDIAFMQDNLVCNARRGTLRGMHWQRFLASTPLHATYSLHPKSPTTNRQYICVLYLSTKKPR